MGLLRRNEPVERVAFSSDPISARWSAGKFEAGEIDEDAQELTEHDSVAEVFEAGRIRRAFASVKSLPTEEISLSLERAVGTA